MENKRRVANPIGNGSRKNPMNNIPQEILKEVLEVLQKVWDALKDFWWG